MSVELGYGMDEVMTAIEVHKLSEDNKFKALVKISQATKEKEERDFVGMCQPDA